MVLCVQVVMEYVGGGSISNLLRNPDTGPVRGEVRKREHSRSDSSTLNHHSCVSPPPPDTAALLPHVAGGSELSALSRDRPQ